MKQKCYEYYCEKKQRNIGTGMCCFDCKLFERTWEVGKKCKHERVTREYERDVP